MRSTTHLQVLLCAAALASITTVHAKDLKGTTRLFFRRGAEAFITGSFGSGEPYVNTIKSSLRRKWYRAHGIDWDAVHANPDTRYALDALSIERIRILGSGPGKMILGVTLGLRGKTCWRNGANATGNPTYRPMEFSVPVEGSALSQMAGKIHEVRDAFAARKHPEQSLPRSRYPEFYRYDAPLTLYRGVFVDVRRDRTPKELLRHLDFDREREDPERLAQGIKDPEHIAWLASIRPCRTHICYSKSASDAAGQIDYASQWRGPGSPADKNWFTAWRSGRPRLIAKVVLGDQRRPVHISRSDGLASSFADLFGPPDPEEVKGWYVAFGDSFYRVQALSRLLSTFQKYHREYTEAAEGQHPDFLGLTKRFAAELIASRAVRFERKLQPSDPGRRGE